MGTPEIVFLGIVGLIGILFLAGLIGFLFLIRDTSNDIKSITEEEYILEFRRKCLLEEVVKKSIEDKEEMKYMIDNILDNNRKNKNKD